MSGCAKTNNHLVEQAPSYQPQPSSASTQLQLPKVSAPKLADVEEAINRVFKRAAKLDQTTHPNFIVGDFNGDQSEDLAVVLKPVELAAMNEEYPAWLLRDPLLQTQSRSTTLRIAENETLLAVIHGYGPNEWRDAQATQTFLLKNVAVANMETKKAVEFLKGHPGRKLPRAQGDVITETLQGSQGCLYYSGANYRWYDPNTFRGESDLKTVHTGMKKDQ
ncbi:MAG: hypothetical protein C5B55_03600 [Blastocatellia bacterium]|nr:MAG: hypothetical protein C5B55_03600 [Blastocatellia bacterium]